MGFSMEKRLGEKNERLGDKNERLGDKNERLGEKNERLGEKNGYSHPLFYGSFMWECNLLRLAVYYKFVELKILLL